MSHQFFFALLDFLNPLPEFTMRRGDVTSPGLVPAALVRGRHGTGQGPNKKSFAVQVPNKLQGLRMALTQFGIGILIKGAMSKGGVHKLQIFV